MPARGAFHGRIGVMAGMRGRRQGAIPHGRDRRQHGELMIGPSLTAQLRLLGHTYGAAAFHGAGGLRDAGRASALAGWGAGASQTGLERSG